jgi:hypothetical protein
VHIPVDQQTAERSGRAHDLIGVDQVRGGDHGRAGGLQEIDERTCGATGCRPVVELVVGEQDRERIEEPAAAQASSVTT